MILLTFVAFCLVVHGSSAKAGGLTARLPVLGRTRVGKGEFVETAVLLCQGIHLNITSPRPEPHTQTHQGYPACGLSLMDTVGYDHDTDGGEEATVKLLASFGKDPFYPPLIILRSLGQ